MTDVVMPQMGESIVEGTLTKWLKKPGDRVERDEPLFEISTDKVDTEIPSPAAGTLSEVLVEEGKTVGINTIVARIDEGGGAAAAPRSGETCSSRRSSEARGACCAGNFRSASRARGCGSRPTARSGARSARSASRARGGCSRPTARSGGIGFGGAGGSAFSAGAEDGAREQCGSEPHPGNWRGRPHHEAGC